MSAIAFLTLFLLSRRKHLLLTKCQKCNTMYSPEKSRASLRNTWCTATCEKNDIGFVIDDWINPNKSDVRITKPDQIQTKSVLDLDSPFRSLPWDAKGDDSDSDDDGRNLVPV